MAAFHGRDATPCLSRTPPKEGWRFCYQADLWLRPTVQSTECTSCPLCPCGVRQDMVPDHRSNLPRQAISSLQCVDASVPPQIREVGLHRLASVDRLKAAYR